MAKKNVGGRPRKIKEGSDTVRKLVDGFTMGFNIQETCDYAGISKEAYYDNLKKYKWFSDEMTAAQTALQRQAKINLAKSIQNGSLDESKYYLERKCKDEFSTKQEIQHSGDMTINNPFNGLTTDELRKMIDNG